MAKLTTNLMASDNAILVYSKDMGAHLKITTGGVSGTRFLIEVVDSDGEEVEEFVTSEYPLYPDSVEVCVSYELTVTAHRTIDIEFESQEDYEEYKRDPAEYIRANEIIQLYSTCDAIDDASFYEIDDANITDVDEV